MTHRFPRSGLTYQADGPFAPILVKIAGGWGVMWGTTVVGVIQTELLEDLKRRGEPVPLEPRAPAYTKPPGAP